MSKVGRRIRDLLLVTGTLFMILSGETSAQEKSFNAVQFLESYCVDCHSKDAPDGDRDLETLDLADSRLDSQLRIQEVIDQLTLYNMPPKDADQPAEKERLAAIRSLTEILSRHRKQATHSGGSTVLRRLNRREYRNTVSDLLGIDMTMFDPTQEFPDDNLSEQFDTIGNTLSTSGFLLEKYLQAADQCVEKAFSAELPTARTWEFKDYFYQQPELQIAHRKAFNHKYMVLYDHPNNDKPEGAYGPLHNFKGGVPADGIYEVRVRAQALHRDTAYSSRAVFIDLSEPFRMGIRPGDTRIGDLVHNQPIQPLLAEAVIEDDELKWYKFEVPLDRGFTPRFTFENGQHDVRGSYGRIFRQHRQSFPKDARGAQGIVEMRNAAVRVGELPQIRIHEVQIKGPLASSPQKSILEKILGEESFRPQAVPEYLARFLDRAFRRPAQKKELARIQTFYESRLRQGLQPVAAFKDTLKAILCSSEFLYFSPALKDIQVEGKKRSIQEHSEALDSYALAERLSYFLTSSMPDSHLRELAQQNQLLTQETLKKEVERLLNLPASDRFVRDFLDNWLNLRSLGTMPPDVQQFRVYYASSLEPEMKKETELFFRDLITNNRSVDLLLDSDFSFVNRDLAKLYKVADQIPIERAGEFHRVQFKDASRGGLLGQASVLTVSANGIETSPVTRGVWILENILGTTPPPPPDDVPAIDPDVRGTKSIRDRLNKHRESATCNQCHRKIDPLGFALEGFDPIGRSRDYYNVKRRIRVDTSGELPGGQKFSSIAELKKLLLKRKEFFVRTLTQRLLSHALGRHVEPEDREAVDQIVAQSRKNDFRLRDLIVTIAQSDLFARP